MQLLLGSCYMRYGMRITEALDYESKDVDFGHKTLIVREGQGAKIVHVAQTPDQITCCIWLRCANLNDRRAGVGPVWMPPSALFQVVPMQALSVGNGSGCSLRLL